MISFDVSRKVKMNSFMSWNNWVEITLYNEVIKDYMLIQLSEIRMIKQRFILRYI